MFVENRIEKQKLWRGRFWRYAPLIFWVIIIFIASSNAGSHSNTSRIIRPILVFLFPEISEHQLITIQFLVRKTAHFTFYFILGALAARAFSGSLQKILRRNWLLISFLLVCVVASLDETNQSFLASRTASARDVLIDVCGGFIALLIWFLMSNYRNKNSN